MVNMIKQSLLKGIYLFTLKFKPILKKIIPESIKSIGRSLENKLLRSDYKINYKIDDALKCGINLIGYSHAEMGIGESCRLAANAIQTTDIPFGIINFTAGNPGRMNDLSWSHKEMEAAPYRANIFHINAEQMPLAYIHLGKSVFNGHFNIGYWHWELPDFPDEWCNSFKLVQEIWVPTNFVRDSISPKSPVPVVRIPHAIQVNYDHNVHRDFFMLPETPFLFLSMYDTNSYQERKNPQAAIDAFEHAFGKDDVSVGLVIKVTNSESNPIEMDKLKQKIQGSKNIYLITDFMGRNEVNALINSIDCFVSLHRSEGFGLGLAEAMYLGKPVIGTNWSGNIDFMNGENSCVVDYKLIEVGNDYGPYKADQVWADPDIEQAAYYMRKVVTDLEWRETIAINGQETIRGSFSPQVVGGMIKQRLTKLGLL